LDDQIDDPAAQAVAHRRPILVPRLGEVLRGGDLPRGVDDHALQGEEVPGRGIEIRTRPQEHRQGRRVQGGRAHALTVEGVERGNRVPDHGEPGR
jgi:hypothetical protein